MRLWGVWGPRRGLGASGGFRGVDTGGRVGGREEGGGLAVSDGLKIWGRGGGGDLCECLRCFFF